MGNEESRVRAARRAPLQRMILEAFESATVITDAMLEKSVIGSLSAMHLIPLRRQKEFIRIARKRLQKQGILSYRSGTLHLTEAGRKKLSALLLRGALATPSKWDSKWRVLIFDIPERRKKDRERVRHTLQQVGFCRLQDSVWVYPHDCEDFIVLLKTDFRIGKEMLYLIVDSIEGDSELRKHFGLPIYV